MENKNLSSPWTISELSRNKIIRAAGRLRKINKIYKLTKSNRTEITEYLLYSDWNSLNAYLRKLETK